MAKTKEEKIAYSDAVREIETILRHLETETMDVDKLAEEVKRATQLIALCRERLRATNQEMDKLFGETEA